jgi:predicted nucleotidyltransferase
MRHVTEELLQEIRRRVVEAIRPEKIVLFGSHAWGAPGVESDVDLYIVAQAAGEPSYRRARAVYRALRGIGVPVDVVTQTPEEAERKKRVPASLVRRILLHGRVLYG